MAASHVYFVIGVALCAALAWIWAHYFRRERKERVEAPKYKMLEDEE